MYKKTMRNISVFLPAKKRSTRVPNKNSRNFANIKFGLLKIKLTQLSKVKLIKKIVLSTNDQKIISFVRRMKFKKVLIHKRKNRNLSTDKGSVQNLIEHVIDIMPEDHILWTHITSPFISSKDYKKIISKYFSVLKKKKNDSLMTVTKFQEYLWDEKKPLNYKKKIDDKWPKTQSLKTLNVVNSGVFLSSKKNYRKFRDRVGIKPYIYPLDKKTGFDIDHMDDFRLAEIMFKQKK